MLAEAGHLTALDPAATSPQLLADVIRAASRAPARAPLAAMLDGAGHAARALIRQCNTRLASRPVAELLRERSRYALF
jgi:DTW domain-containing protein YfiP